jgi:hypothetical protein
MTSKGNMFAGLSLEDDEPVQQQQVKKQQQPKETKQVEQKPKVKAPPRTDNDEGFNTVQNDE